MPMKQDIKTEWLRRLRQPERMQGVGVLRDVEGEQCCLDLLMEIAVERGVQSPPVLRTSERCYYYPDDSGFPESGLLTQAVVEWSGVSYSDPFVRLDDITRDKILSPSFEEDISLSGLNDAGGVNFTEIADLIEADENI